MYQEYKDRVAFLFVYISEAHASDEWQMDSNVTEKVVFSQPATLPQRREVAGQCCKRMKISMPTVVDEMDNRVDAAYAAWPERMFVVDSDGRIAYAGKQGPWGFKPNEVEEWLRDHVGRPAKK
jgi:hypothetical protein